MSTTYCECVYKKDGTEKACYKEIDSEQLTNEVITCAAKVAYEKALAEDSTTEKPASVTKWEANTEPYWQHYFYRLVKEAASRAGKWGVYCETTSEKVTFDKISLALVVGNTWSISATILPVTVDITWSSSDETIATVASDGTVTAVAAGTATITGTTADGNTATCSVTVTAE